jgi:hypothetical protein
LENPTFVAIFSHTTAPISPSCRDFIIANSNLDKESVAQDLESFAKHAGRLVVATDDVLLLARRNDALAGVLREFVELQAEKGARNSGKGKGRR